MGRKRSIAAKIASDVFRELFSTLKIDVEPQTTSSTNGTAASMMLNAMPPARNSTLSSPALSQTRLA